MSKGIKFLAEELLILSHDTPRPPWKVSKSPFMSYVSHEREDNIRGYRRICLHSPSEKGVEPNPQHHKNFTFIAFARNHGPQIAAALLKCIKALENYAVDDKEFSNKFSIRELKGTVAKQALKEIEEMTNEI